MIVMAGSTNESRRSLIYADGTRMCIGFPGMGVAHLVHGYHIENMSVEHRWDGLIGIQTGIIGFPQDCRTISHDEAASLFANADAMSVNDLLAAAFKKMHSRP
jgi:hypothetical protein